MMTPSLVDLTVTEFIDRLASETPLPGGGSAAALAGAQGAALAAMVARLTVGRPRYAEHEAAMVAIRDAADALRTRLLALVDADARTYLKVMVAYQMPKETGPQAACRAETIRAELRHATETQLEVADLCLQALELAAAAAAHGNRNAASDAAVGALVAHAGLQGATRNVHTNLALIRDADYNEVIGCRVDEIAAVGDGVLARALVAADAAVLSV